MVQAVQWRYNGSKMPSFAIENHPQKAKIIKWILAGDPVRDIAARAVPPVSFNSVQRYKSSIIRPMLSRAESEKRILNGDFPKIRESVPLSPDTEAAKAVQQAILDAPAIHILENRLKLQQHLTDRLLRVVNERAVEMSVCEACRRPESAHPWEEMRPGKDADGNDIEVRYACDVYRRVPGGETGLVVRKLKSTGVEYAVDTAVLAEIREQEKHVAVELGQWQENAGTGAVQIQIVCPVAPAESRPRITFAAPAALEAAVTEDDDGIAEIAVVPQK